MNRKTATLVFGAIGAAAGVGTGALIGIGLAYHSETIGLIGAIFGAIGTMSAATAAFLSKTDTPEVV